MFFVATAGIANLATMGFVRYIKLCVPSLGKANAVSFIAKIKMKLMKCVCVCVSVNKLYYLRKVLNR